MIILRILEYFYDFLWIFIISYISLNKDSATCEHSHGNYLFDLPYMQIFNPLNTVLFAAVSRIAWPPQPSMKCTGNMLFVMAVASLLTSNGLRSLRSSGDGHCLLYSVYTSWWVSYLNFSLLI